MVRGTCEDQPRCLARAHQDSTAHQAVSRSRGRRRKYVEPAEGARTTSHGTSGTAWAAIVLAGGTGRRLGGVDKPGLRVGDRTLLDRALSAVSGAEPVVVVGPFRPGLTGVVQTREEPPGAGPLAALVAGLAHVPPTVREVAVFAADLVAVAPSTVERLRGALRDETDADGAVLVDEHAAVQWLIGVWRTDALRAALPDRTAGHSLRAALGRITRVDVPAWPGEALDVDTPEDLARVT
ncbi:molybdenum cofactor guanylyltransferase [Longimycelium tulufanense]|uniref:Molybdenum cofactor guanylyltransferase n=1 Tax=Longimycelium tulufanense TaxID=907463 RepID=A0A8J3CEM5_9PSEU|nr:molybdenum cofactor guanylyltransferase [Longimycelium tulufanense]GGM56101.1 molybdenum cofactor guanylyltransferase [Longimycelium tulufanense]